MQSKNIFPQQAPVLARGTVCFTKTSHLEREIVVTGFQLPFERDYPKEKRENLKKKTDQYAMEELHYAKVNLTGGKWHFKYTEN